MLNRKGSGVDLFLGIEILNPVQQIKAIPHIINVAILQCFPELRSDGKRRFFAWRAKATLGNNILPLP
jgi:hypothetical protein